MKKPVISRAQVEENIVGVLLPVFKLIRFTLTDYAYLNSPHWYEALLDLVKELFESRKQEGHYFDFEALLVYLLRWDIIDYWSKFNKEKVLTCIDELSSSSNSLSEL